MTDDIKELIEEIKKLNNTLKDYRLSMLPTDRLNTDAKSWQEISQGDVKTKKFGDYYDKHFATSQAVASNPNDFDSPLYNINYTDPATLTTTSVRGATIFQEMERYSDVIYVYNDGTTYNTANYLYVTVSHGSMGLGHEEFVKPGESKAIYNVFELRFRSPTTNLPFRVSEYPIYQTCCPTTSTAIPYKLISAASTNATSLKASAGQIYGIQASNINAAVRYLKLYNKASAPTVGTDIPVKVITIPSTTVGGSIEICSVTGISFTTGIAFALTTGMADSDIGAVAATEIAVNIDYV